MSVWKKQVKRMLPKLIVERIDEFRFRRVNLRADAAFAGDKPIKVFADVYKNGVWGRTADAQFYSGDGSHSAEIVDPYVKALVRFLSSFPVKPSVVDLGCGDFNIGRLVRGSCGKYIACDIVADLIDYNRTRFADLDVDFRCLDAVSEDLPDAEVIFIRQVFQHLSNDHIGKIVPKLSKYRFLVLTEMLPAKSSFRSNAEKRTGPGIRIAYGSGIVITDPPFCLPSVAQHSICSIPIRGTVIRTMVYQLR